MPDLSLNYAETPPWLKNDAQESTFLRDVEAGQRINSQRQQLPLKLKALQQDAQMNELKIGEHIRQRDDLLRAEQEAQGLGETIAPLLDQEQPDKAMNALLAAGIRKPILFKSPQWQTMMKEVQAAMTAKRAQRQLETLEGLRLSQEEENLATARWRQAQAEKAALTEGDPGIEILDIPGTGKKAIRVQGANTLHIVEPEKMSRMQELEYRQALSDLSNIERELAKEPPHPEGRDEKGERVPVQSDKRQNLLEELIKAKKRVARITTQASNAVTTAGQTPAAPATVSPVGMGNRQELDRGLPQYNFPPRPEGMTDDELRKEAEEALKQGKKDPAWIRGALEAWGVK